MPLSGSTGALRAASALCGRWRRPNQLNNDLMVFGGDIHVRRRPTRPHEHMQPPGLLHAPEGLGRAFCPSASPQMLTRPSLLQAGTCVGRRALAPSRPGRRAMPTSSLETGAPAAPLEGARSVRVGGHALAAAVPPVAACCCQTAHFSASNLAADAGQITDA